MNCVEWEAKIARYVDGEAAPEVEEHLARCPDCAALARAMDEDRSRLRAEPPEAAAIDFPALRRGIRREIVREGCRKRWRAGGLSAGGFGSDRGRGNRLLAGGAAGAE